ncbi:MAG TPA: hypothetical protein VFS43_15215 [Polyangiaceae bacterium]|nr:hypothetical protein [Polyangiaceae bacterium]
MRRATSAWPLRLAIASMGLWACNALTGANNLVIEGQSGSGSEEGDGGTGGDDDDGEGGDSASGGSGGAGSVTCGTTETSGDECRACCASQRRGVGDPIPIEQIESIRGCLCERTSGGLSDACQGCRNGICAGRENPDQLYVSDCNSCFNDGTTCPDLTTTCRNLPDACVALVTCLHACQLFDRD